VLAGGLLAVGLLTAGLLAVRGPGIARRYVGPLPAGLGGRDLPRQYPCHALHRTPTPVTERYHEPGSAGVVYPFRPRAGRPRRRGQSFHVSDPKEH